MNSLHRGIFPLRCKEVGHVYLSNKTSNTCAMFRLSFVLGKCVLSIPRCFFYIDPKVSFGPKEVTFSSD